MNNVEALRRLVLVAELGSVSHAAQTLLIAQPALSRQLHRLEKDLGRTLFTRVGRTLQLTEFGKRVVEQAISILADLDSLESIGQRFKDPSGVCIGASHSSLNGFLPEVVTLFHKMHPDTEIRMQTARSATVYDLVESGCVDIGVISAPQPRLPIVTQNLFRDSLILICAKGHPLAENATLSPHRLDNVPIILPNVGTGLRNDVDSIFSSFNVGLNLRMEVNNIEVIQRMVQAHMGVSILRRSYPLYHKTLATVPLEVPNYALRSGTEHLISLIYRPNELSSGAQSWIDICHRIAKTYS